MVRLERHQPRGSRAFLAISGLSPGSWRSTHLADETELVVHRTDAEPRDRELVRSPLIAMTTAGWRQNNTLSDHFFNAEDQAINQAGEIKVRWIVTQAPPHRRVVFVLRGSTPEATSARIEAVQRAIEKHVPEGPRPDVLLTDIVPPGASGDYFDQVDRQFKESIPAPRLPVMQDTTGGGN